MGQRRAIREVLEGYPKEVILKDGTGVTLRPLEPGDERPLHALFGRLSEDDLWFLNHDVTDAELIRSWIGHLDVERVISLVALLEGRIIANAALMMKRFGAKSHIGKVRITVDPAFRERRLGTWMLLDLGNAAIAIGLRILVMRLTQDRDAAIIQSVDKLGYRQEAVLKNYVLDSQGNPHSLVIMVKRLPMPWEEEGTPAPL